MTVFEFEIQICKRIKVDGFSSSAKEMARAWLINHLEEELLGESFSDATVSDGRELQAEDGVGK